MISPVAFNKTEADLIRNIIEAYTFLDFGTVTKVVSESFVDLSIGAHFNEADVIVTNVELLSFGGSNMKIKVMPKEGDILLVFTPRSYIKTLASIEDRSKVSRLKYQLANCKAVLFIPAANESATVVEADEEGLSITSDKLVIDCPEVTFDGTTMSVNGDTDAVVLHSQLSTILSSFVTQLNMAIGTKLNGGGSPGTLVLDLAPAKSVSLKVGS